MKVLFLGSGTLGLPTLSALKQSSHTLTGIITLMDKPQGRGRKVSVSPIRQWAIDNDVKAFDYEVMQKSDSVSILKSFGAQVFIVVSFGKILPQSILDIPIHGCFNLHPSLLPKYRGASPIPEALLQGDIETGVSIFKLSAKMDEGDIALQERVKLNSSENAADLWRNLSEKGADLVVEVLDSIESNSLTLKSQSHSEATYCKKHVKSDAVIEWEWDALKIHNRVRAFSIWPGTEASFKEKRLKILKTQLNLVKQSSTNPGEVLDVDSSKGILIACGSGSLWVSSVQLEGKKPMDAESFVNGYHIKPGIQLNNGLGVSKGDKSS